MVNIFFEETEDLCLDQPFFFTWLSEVVSRETLVLGEINIVFTNNKKILSINKDHLNHNTYTDIVTLDYRVGDLVFADLFISVDMLRFNAKKYSKDFFDELCRVVVHGVLHVCGYKDRQRAEKVIMKKKEEECLSLRSIL